MTKANQNIPERRDGLIGCLARLVRYRVVEERISETKTLFKPQKMYLPLPIWWSYTTSHTGYDANDLYFANLKAAEAHNEKDRISRNFRASKKIHLPNDRDVS